MNIEAILGPYCVPDETALDLFARTWSEPVPTGVPFFPLAMAGQVIEIAGPTACGKSSFLLQAAVQAILPNEHDGIQLGGNQEHAIFIDLDNKFDVVRLMEMLHGKIEEGCALQNREARSEMVDAIMKQSLGRFYLVLSLEERPTRQGAQATHGLRLLLIDNIAAFYWLDSAVRPVLQQGVAQNTLTLNTVHKVAAASIRMLSRQFKLAVLVSKHAFRAPAEIGEEDDWTHKEVMSKGWEEIVSQRVLLKPLSGGVGDLPLKLGAKMHKPRGQTILTFCISTTGIVESSW